MKLNLYLGKWRVIVRHVPENRLLLARIATGYEVRLSVTGSALKPSTEQKTEAATKRGRFDEGVAMQKDIYLVASC